MPATVAGIVSVERGGGPGRELLVRDARDSYTRFNCRRTGFRRESQCCLRSGVAARGCACLVSALADHGESSDPDVRYGRAQTA